MGVEKSLRMFAGLLPSELRFRRVDCHVSVVSSHVLGDTLANVCMRESLSLFTCPFIGLLLLLKLLSLVSFVCCVLCIIKEEGGGGGGGGGGVEVEFHSVALVMVTIGDGASLRNTRGWNSALGDVKCA